MTKDLECFKNYEINFLLKFLENFEDFNKLNMIHLCSNNNLIRFSTIVQIYDLIYPLGIFLGQIVEIIKENKELT